MVFKLALLFVIIKAFLCEDKLYCTQEWITTNITVPVDSTKSYKSSRVVVKEMAYPERVKVMIFSVDYKYLYCPTSEGMWFGKCIEKSGSMSYSSSSLLEMSSRQQCHVGSSCNHDKCGHVTEVECFSPSRTDWMDKNTDLVGVLEMELLYWRCTRSYRCNILETEATIFTQRNNELKLYIDNGLHCNLKQNSSSCQLTNGMWLQVVSDLSPQENSQEILCVTGLHHSICHNAENGEDLMFDEEDMCYVNNHKYRMSHVIELIHEKIQAFPSGYALGSDLENVYRTLQFENLNTNLNLMTISSQMNNIQLLIKSILVGYTENKHFLDEYLGLSLGNVSMSDNLLWGKVCRRVDVDKPKPVQLPVHSHMRNLFPNTTLSMVELEGMKFHIMDLPPDLVQHFYEEGDTISGDQVEGMKAFFQGLSSFLSTSWASISNIVIFFDTLCIIFILFKVKLK